MNNVELDGFAYHSQLESGSANIMPFVKENFQLTHDEAVLGHRVNQMIAAPEQATVEERKINLIIIDGEFRTLAEEAPIDGVSFPAGAGLLTVRKF